MYLDNTYKMLVGFLNYVYIKILKPKTFLDNVIGSFFGLTIIFILILFYLKFLS